MRIGKRKSCHCDILTRTWHQWQYSRSCFQKSKVNMHRVSAWILLCTGPRQVQPICRLVSKRTRSTSIHIRRSHTMALTLDCCHCRWLQHPHRPPSSKPATQILWQEWKFFIQNLNSVWQLRLHTWYGHRMRRSSTWLRYMARQLNKKRPWVKKDTARPKFYISKYKYTLTYNSR